MSDFCQFSLPYSDPGDVAEWVRQGRDHLYVVRPLRLPSSDGSLRSIWLHGKIGRLLLIWLSTQVVRAKHNSSDPVITLPKSEAQFKRELGLRDTGGQTNIANFRRHLQALAGYSMTVSEQHNSGDQHNLSVENSMLIDKADYSWKASGSDTTAQIQLNPATWQRMKTASIPLDAEIIEVLSTKGKGQEIDIYAWLSRTVFGLRHDPQAEITITWEQLERQFGAQYSRADNFRQFFKQAFEHVAVFWPGGLHFEWVPRTGLRLMHSRPSVHPKSK
ncbi:replication protein RepA [Bifidobacterium xylocopae]|nr:replication protein RepA [Bifidobacterium xylocopae]